MLGAAMIAAGRVFGLIEILIVGTVAVAAAVGSVAVRRLRPSSLSVDRTVSPRLVPTGESARVQIRILNRSRWRSPILRIRDCVTGAGEIRLPVAPLAGGHSISHGYELPTSRRGVVEVGPMIVDDMDPLGMARISHDVAGRERLIVHPPFETLSAVRLRSSDEPAPGEHHRQCPRPSSEDFDGLRPYVSGDDPRRIHWRSTAHHDELMVRQYRPPQDGSVAVVIDTRPPSHLESAQDRTASVAASITEAVLDTGYEVRLQTTDGRATSTLTDPTWLDSALEFLARLEGGNTLIHPTVPVSGSTVVAVTADPDVATDAAARARLVERLGAALIVTCDTKNWDDPGLRGGRAGNWIHLTGPGQLTGSWSVPAVDRAGVTG